VVETRGWFADIAKDVGLQTVGYTLQAYRQAHPHTGESSNMYNIRGNCRSGGFRFAVAKGGHNVARTQGD